MKTGFLGALGCLLAGAGFVAAQSYGGGPAYPFGSVPAGYGYAPTGYAAYPYGPAPYPYRNVASNVAYPGAVSPTLTPGAVPAGLASTATVVSPAPEKGVAAPSNPQVVAAAATTPPAPAAPTGAIAASIPDACPATGCCPDAACPEPACAECAPKCKSDCKCMFVTAEYLLWAVKKGPVPVPTAANFDPVTGDISILQGPRDVSFGADSGLRIGVGGWLDADQRWGVEAEGFVLGKRNASFGAVSDPTKRLFIPITNPPDPNAFAQYIVAFESSVIPGDHGDIQVALSTRLWGAETNGLLRLYRNNNFNVSLLGGFRYFALEETLTVNSQSEAPPIPPQTGATDPGYQFSSSDQFRTLNTFYGGQIGCRVDYRGGPWSLGLMGKVAAGPMHERLQATGFEEQDGPSSFADFNGAFARVANIQGLAGLPVPTAGTFQSTVFAVVPEGRVELAYDIGRHTTVDVGYTYLYANAVLRPGNVLPSTLLSSLPGPQFRQSDFWAQGLDIGLTFSW